MNCWNIASVFPMISLISLHYVISERLLQSQVLPYKMTLYLGQQRKWMPSSTAGQKMPPWSTSHEMKMPWI